MALRGAQQKQATEHRTVNTKQRKSNTGRLGVAKPVKARSMHTRRVVYVKAQQSSQQQTDQGEQSKDVFETPGTLGEKEARFLEALRSFYYDGRPMISNEEFDSLKDELTWQGSRVIQLNGTEQRFLEAYKSYNAGKPVLSDEEYDELKRELQRQNSPVVMQGPRCSIRTQRVYSDASVDYFKEAILNVPGAIITLLILFLFDAATSYRVTYLVELPEPYSFLFTWGVVIPGIYYGAVTLTNFAIKDPLILKGPCPNCGEPNWTFFGSIFNIEVRAIRRHLISLLALIELQSTHLSFLIFLLCNRRAIKAQALWNVAIVRRRWISTKIHARLFWTLNHFNRARKVKAKAKVKAKPKRRRKQRHLLVMTMETTATARRSRHKRLVEMMTEVKVALLKERSRSNNEYAQCVNAVLAAASC